MPVQNLSNIAVQFKEQTALGTPATGVGGFGVEVMASAGLAMQIATIESAMIQRSRMRKRPRHGSRSVTAAYETELTVGGLDPVIEAVLGGDWVSTFDLTEADMTSVTITGTGVTVTAGGGSWITEGIVAGMMVKFADLSVGANNDKWVPVLNVTATVLTLAPGYLIDNGADTTFTLTVARHVATATPYVDRLFTAEEYQQDLDLSKIGTDMRFNSLNVDCQANAHVKIGFGLGGRNMAALASGASPSLTGITAPGDDSLVLIDGGLFINGLKRANVTGFSFGLAAPVSTIPVIGTNISPDVFLGQFSMTGNFNAVVDSFDDFTLFNTEADISILLHCAEKEGSPQQFTTFYLGHTSFAGYSSPAGGEGGAIATIPIYGGADNRGAGFAATSVLVSTSAA